MHDRASHGPLTLACIALATSAIAACEQVNVVLVDVASIEVEPAEVILERGESRQLSATLTAEDGHELNRRTIQWTTSDGSIAEVTAEGHVTGIGAGQARIFARADGVEGAADVSVMEPPPQYTIPATPSEMKAEDKGKHEIELTWRDNADDETHYLLQRRRRSSGDWDFQLELAANATSHRDRGLDEDRRYWYRVLACNPAGCAASQVVSERTDD